MQLSRGVWSAGKASFSLLIILVVSVLSVQALLLLLPRAESAAPGSISLVSHIPQGLGAVYLYKGLWTLKPQELRLHSSFRNKLEGFVVGSALGLLFGALSPHQPAETSSLAPFLVVAGVRQSLLVSAPEEMLFRGFYLRALSETIPLRNSLLFSSFAFGLFHFANLLAGAEISEVVVQAIIGILTGILFGLLYIKGGLVPPILSHGGLNFFLIVARTFPR